jgi:hypothetical protein
MSALELFWAAVVAFSVISFTFMSVKILYKGLPELRDMFKSLNEDKPAEPDV